jgi:hypothetical protein
MSKDKTDNLEAYTSSGTMTVLSPLTLSGSNQLTVGGAATVGDGLTVDGTSQSLVVNTGELQSKGDFKVGPDAASPNASITSAGAASFASLVVNGSSISPGTGAEVHAFGTATKSGTGTGVGSGVGFNIASVNYTASTISPTNRFGIGIANTAGQSITSTSVGSTSVSFGVANDVLQTISFVVVAA